MGLISISFVNALLDCTCKFQYASAIASGSILPSGGESFNHSFVLGMSITPSMMAWATCTPLGANSLATLWAKARIAYFAVLKLDMRALDFTEAVAPVKMRVGGYLAEGSSACWRSRGRVCCEKKKAPLLFDHQYLFPYIIDSSKANSPTDLPTPRKLPLRQLQNTLPSKRPTSIKDRRGQSAPSKFLLRLFHSTLHTSTVADISADANGFAA